MTAQMTISVRDLMAYVFRKGSIDNRFRTATTLQEGTAIHQEIQKKYGEKDQREVPLTYTFSEEGIDVCVQGRCDGLLEREEGTIIDEIKSTAMSLDTLTEDSHPVYWAQAKGYAFIYAKTNNVERLTVQITYVQKQSKELKQYRRLYSLEELEDFMNDCMKTYVSYAHLLVHIREQKQTSIPDLSFPFSTYRAGQRKLAGSVYRTIEEKRDLFAQAPTGIGKTISTLFPAIKAMTLEDSERLFYLTAKTVTRATAEEALMFMQENGLSIRSVTLTAKDKICFQEETICQPDYCEFADGYYDRINGALVDVLKNETLLTRTVIETYARKHKVCPFEFSLDLSDAVDVVIGDYNYIYDPRVSLKRLLPEDKKKTTLLVDESHNLVERARDMFSASLTAGEFQRIEEGWMDEDKDLAKAGAAVYKDLLDVMDDSKQASVISEVPVQLEEGLERFLSKAENYLKDVSVEEQSEHLLDVYFSAQNFLKILQLVDVHYRCIGYSKGGDFICKLYCIDPSKVLSDTTKAFRSSIFFSATLSPFGYYKEMLGGKKEDYILKLPSPYNAEQIDFMIAPLSTRYKSREQTAERLAELLYDQVQTYPGNHLFFFPSYHYMELIYRVYKTFQTQQVVAQEQGMDEERREDFLAQFIPGGNLVGFAVLGGVFSEGVDLRGDRLNGVAVIGIGLAPRSFEKELIKEYFDNKGKQGYDYAYVYPGMNKVLQAGGRLIRSETDRGAIQLIDDRFLSPKYVPLLPEDWGKYRIVK